MKNKAVIISFLLLFFMLDVIKAQDKYLGDTIIDLDEVLVEAKGDFFVLKPERGRKMSMRGETGKTSIVSKVNVDKDKKYNIKAIEFFFKHKKQNVGKNQFYIRPLLLAAVEGKPGTYYLNSKTVYAVSKKVRENIYIDLSKYDIEIKNVDDFFVGVEFVGKSGGDLYNDFNITMLKLKNKTGTSFIKGTCPKCVFSPLYLPDNIGLSLKYNIYYK